MASKAIHHYKHALHVEKEREHRIREAMKERMAAEQVSHVAQRHMRKSQGISRSIRHVGKGVSLVGFLVVIIIIALAFFMIARQYHLFGL